MNADRLPAPAVGQVCIPWDMLRLYEVLACYTALAITPTLAALASVLGWRAGKLHYELGELAHRRLIEWRDGRKRRVLRVVGGG